MSRGHRSVELEAAIVVAVLDCAVLRAHGDSRGRPAEPRRAPTIFSMTTIPERETCWTMIRRAAEGDAAARGEFVRHYAEPLRAYFAARWRAGALERGAQASSFRAFLAGVARNVALRIEQRRARDHARVPPAAIELDERAGREEAASAVFDRAWARSVMRQAAERLRMRALAEGGPEARRVELLRMRFDEGLPIRRIAALWNEAPALLHHEYALAREDFRRALLDLVGRLGTGTSGESEAEVGRLLALLSASDPP